MTFSVGTVRNHTPLHYGKTHLDQVNMLPILELILRIMDILRMQLPQESLKANRALFLYKQALKTTGNVNYEHIQ